MNNISFKQYRIIDLAIWAFILTIFESLTVLAAMRWFPGELYMLSQLVAVLCIVMMRWDGYAAAHAVIGGAVFCLVSGGNGPQFAVYCIGNCFALLALLLFRALGKEKVRAGVLYTIIFVAVAFCGAQVGRWLVSLFLGGAPGSIFSFFMTDSLSLLYAVVVVLIARRADGVYEDQRSYLVRTEDERKRRDTPEEYDGDYRG